MSKPRILVTGANGQLGKELREISTRYPDYEFVFLSREDLAIHHFDLVRNFFKTLKPAFCINCAAYTAVDKAEQEKDLAYLVNAEAVGVLAAVCREYAVKFIHISTDYVFDGSAAVPYKEEDAVNPLNVYGASKLKGEQEAGKYNPDVIILRTSWVYSAFGRNFVKTMMKLMGERDSLNVVSDQTGTPTYAADLAEVICEIIHSGKWVPGVYHFSNEGIISWFEFALAIKELTGSHCLVHPIPASQYPTPAARPAYSVLDKSKIRDVYGISLKDWKASLQVCLGKLA